jgi:phage terminase small subunit
MAPPADLAPAEVIAWTETLANAAPGQIRPLDRPLLKRYVMTLCRLFDAMAEHRAWCERKDKAEGETNNLRRARNGELVPVPYLAIIDRLSDLVSNMESKLGLDPVSRERIHVGLQKEIFPKDADEWVEFTN